MTTTVPTPPSRFRRRGAGGGAIALAGALVLVAAACGDDDGNGSADAGSGGESGGETTISVTEPADAAEVRTPFEVEVDTDEELGEPDTGLHHLHLYYDGDTQEGDYDVVYEPSFTVDRDLGPGEHTIEAVVANADHSLTDARDEVTVTVGDAASGAGGGDDDDRNPY
jgi:hypothetical protein